MTKTLDLTANDLEISEDVFCQLMEKQNCLKSNPAETVLVVKKPLKNISATSRSSTTTMTGQSLLMR